MSETPLESQWNTTSYRMFGPDYPDTPLLTTQVVKSALELPFPATLRPGQHTIRVRARDDRGNVQPTSVPFNEQGYLFGAVVAHPVTVE